MFYELNPTEGFGRTFSEARAKTKSLERGLCGPTGDDSEGELSSGTKLKPKRNRSLKFSLGSSPVATVPPLLQTLQSTFTTKDGDSYGLSKEVGIW